jgi:hypothetical protein
VCRTPTHFLSGQGRFWRRRKPQDQGEHPPKWSIGRASSGTRTERVRKYDEKKVDRSIPNRNAFLSIVEADGAALVARGQEGCKKAVNCGAKMMKEGRIGDGNVKSAEIPETG